MKQNITIGELIQNKREEQGKTVLEVAKAIGAPKSVLLQIENHARPPKIKYVLEMAKFLNLTDEEEEEWLELRQTTIRPPVKHKNTAETPSTEETQQTPTNIERDQEEQGHENKTEETFLTVDPTDNKTEPKPQADWNVVSFQREQKRSPSDEPERKNEDLTREETREANNIYETKEAKSHQETESQNRGTTPLSTVTEGVASNQFSVELYPGYKSEIVIETVRNQNEDPKKGLLTEELIKTSTEEHIKSEMTVPQQELIDRVKGKLLDQINDLDEYKEKLQSKGVQ
ncbi:helix-turn-helix transcriptional regulator (plasmid) [Pontibacillus sp. ALD_SL1]|uniref:helix-turn-helix domain-containing protein n=1 Tax=Pontibacillus sp. ALD_SL1 TaxID=2777185 RepID=UPI001A970A75|nr:helix-turn-helix transcriptional regulator [Pontibacillus sp. ALD_SL1]QST02711.1 helix-turn-helix transcriptional regulator [Pontibacillus sp. ALD_SL1]